MAWSGAPLSTVARFLGISKQAISQTVETIVTRGYMNRAEDPADRRRMKLTLTARGERAGKAGRAAIEEIDRELLSRVGPGRFAHARETLAVLLEIKRRNLALSPAEGA